MPHKDPKKRKQGIERWRVNNKVRYMSTIRKRSAKQREILRTYIYELKQKSRCYFCTEDEIVCLDFHHVNSTQKEFSIAQAATKGVSLVRLKTEIDKCVLVCSNCHKKVHAGILVVMRCPSG